MALYLGVDTSNYTTSAALYDSEGDVLFQEKMPLPVKEGERGLRQSDAVFHHVKQLPEVIERLLSGRQPARLAGIGVSVRPRDEEGSYMPCFLAGEGTARSLSAVTGAPLHALSHQTGHILAALYGAGQLALRQERFLAFHVSGGTTEALLVEPDVETLFHVRIVGGSRDLKAGQAVDRIGVLLGLPFPCGPALEVLAQGWEEPVKARASLDGAYCSLSGVENQCRNLLAQEAPPALIARTCLAAVEAAMEGMTKALRKEYGTLPILYAGGVMSNTIIRKRLERREKVFFAPPALSADNAAGAAILTFLREEGNA